MTKKKKSLNKHKIKNKDNKGKKTQTIINRGRKFTTQKKKVPINKMKNIFNTHFCFQKWFCTM